MAGILSFTPPATTHVCAALLGRGGSKHSHRLLSSLHAATDPSAADRLIRKFVASSSKSVSLHTLSHLLSQSSPFSLPIYRRISETPWFRWNPTLVASIIALLEKQGRSAEAETLISESSLRLGGRSTRDLALFYCDLIDSFSEQGLKQQVLDSYARLRETPFSGRRAYESMIKGFCLLGMPKEAEEMVKEMGVAGFRPSSFEFRLIVQAYGRSGLFSEMRRFLEIMENAGCLIDTVCANIVLSCYGDHGDLSEMLSWLRKIRELGIRCSVRTFNSVLNSCPMVVKMVGDLVSLPLSIEGLVRKVGEESLSPDEALLVRELVSSAVLDEMLEWTPSEAKLDLHGFHLASAYIIILQWMEELRVRLGEEKVVPLEVSVVCGSGNHSNVRGESPIKVLVSEIMFRMKSPMRIDRKNVGRFIARGRAVRDWLC